ncbi:MULTISPECIES: type IV secretory system conjugative DNA transfer family protein [unclassified Crossiella]|uniref:type IV secretory system conjugative DNA transfer family protein n=1 Tax=unclassified Crossiella TaxID=2620835 RepID=UPI002000104D|nr:MULTISPECIES: type IV secretion system DNA-binding domain-containing protein [unclassified Crossiella]MCK2241852.1 type IV secretion system DNA-binding domain-containing protein [Crossiella sp. S99.2]MCK2255755.1 type IV secretion system DNA-binding domain-containing protein [Crossiella sp. S99.1]
MLPNVTPHLPPAGNLLEGNGNPYASPIADYLLNPWDALANLATAARDLLLNWGPTAAGVLLVLATSVTLLRRAWRRRNHTRLATDARLITVLAPPTVEPTGAITLWANLIGLLHPAWKRLLHGQPHLSFEYDFTANGLQIQLWVPGLIPPGLVERAIEAAWPGARTHTTPAPPPAHRGHVEAVGGELRLARTEALPIRSTFATDPLRALLGVPATLGPHEHIRVQILARPVTGRRLARARRAAQRLHTGRPINPISSLLDLLTPGTHTTRTNTAAPRLDRQTSMDYTAQDRAIVAKQREPQYDTRIRYLATTTLTAEPTPQERAAIRAVLRGRGHALASAFAPYAEHNHYRRTRLPHPAATIASRRLDTGDLLSVPELAALAHLPMDEAVPGLHRAGARSLTPPPGIATTGPQVKPLGISDTGHPRPIGLHVADARHHLHILGKTGSGKSELIANLVLADAQAGRGAVVIDPKGDLVQDLLQRLPEEVGEKVVLFDADSPTHPPVLNPLEGNDTARTVDNLVSIFARIYASSWGPRTEDILRASLLTLTTQPGTPTLLDVPKLLTVPAFRARATQHLHDEVLLGFWAGYNTLSDPARAHIIAPLMNKLRGLLLRPFVRNALAAGPSTVDMTTVLDGGICLVRIAKDALGIDTTSLVGSIILAATWQAATRRARLPQRRRRDCALYVDECHNFLNLPYPLEDLLAEARGYRLSMVLAHQHLDQLTKDLHAGISANTRSKVFFTASPEDARHLARHTHPRLTEHDLSHLGAFHIATRLLTDGEETRPFTARTRKLPPPIPGRARAIRTAAAANTRPPALAPGPAPRTTWDPRRAA